MSQPNQPHQQDAFALGIRSWDAEHLARCLVSPDVNDVAKDAIRSELLKRGIDLDKATARATDQTALAKSPLTFRQKLLVWGPAVAIGCAIAIGLYLVS